MKPGSVWFGIVLLAVGACGMLDAAGVVDSSQTIGQWWPLAVVGWPLAEMLAARRVSLGGIVCVAVGLTLLADQQQWTSDVVVWSGLAVFIGLAVLAAAVYRRREPQGGAGVAPAGPERRRVMKAAGAARSRLPSLGRRGEGWVALQVAFLAAAVVAGVLGTNWPPAASPWLAAAGVLAAVGGAALLVGGGAGLGRQLTPFPRPVADGALRQHGVYRFVRHPMYGGALLVMLGWALVSSPLALLPLGLAAAFLDAKRRREEAWLLEQHPGYEAYRERVRHCFVPFVW